MEQPYNKPKAFLSYSEKDAKFIQRLADDLRRCQIEPWQFTYEVRHGKPWLDSIFRYGLPTCDAIIAYLTESSLLSAVVSKEIDAGILQKLSDNNVAFLPYVTDTKIRSLLRPDIQAIQTPVWNDDNYSTLLPVVVSEIWRSYLERTVSSATKDERLKRVEAELELEKYKSQPDEVFAKSENKEFEFIWNSFNRTIPIELDWMIRNSETHEVEIEGTSEFVLHLSSVVALLSDFFTQEYRMSYLRSAVTDVARDLVDFDREDPDRYLDASRFSSFFDFTDELLMHGLIEKFTYTSHIDDSDYLEHKFELSKKYFRFRFWLAYQQKLPDHVLIEIARES
jgi:TIR domain-containing protein